MGMVDHYVFDNDGTITHIKDNAAPFSQDELKACPTCRGSLRNIARYGRVVRRSMLDAATKKFVTSSNRTFVELAHAFATEQESLSATQDDFDKIVPGLQEACSLNQSRSNTIRAIPNSIRYGRYSGILILRKKIVNFVNQVATSEQPFARMYQHAQNARRRRGTEATVEFDSQIIQTRGHILASTLLLRCDLAIITDFLGLRRDSPTLPTTGALSVDFSAYRKGCEEVIDHASASHQVRQLTEAHTFWAHFAALERSVTTEDIQKSAALKDEATVHLAKARTQCLEHAGSTAGLDPAIEAVELMLQQGTFYTQVTNEEMRQVIAAMATEFSGTGHWYYCENNHPFTVGECGRPMETTRCPQCGAPVGGQHHQEADGVRRARDLEEEFGNLHI